MIPWLDDSGDFPAVERALRRPNGLLVAGGVYLLDAPNEGLRLVSHAGLSSRFVDEVSYYGPETPQVRLVMQGEPLYWCDFTDALDSGALLEREGLTCLVAIPIKFDGRIVAVANLAPRTLKEFHKHTRQALEAIAAGIGGIVARVRAEDSLRLERENLAETNAALKVLLRQRVVDQKEVEDTLLTNVGKLVTPFVEKFMKTRLTPEQAMFHFLSGYTAKVAGTERGIVEPKATFSACFGAPFMAQHPRVYAEMLGRKIAQHGVTCWLVNTGWTGGSYGAGSRMKIAYTRAMITAALGGKLDEVPFVPDPVFGVLVPLGCPGVPSEVLAPRGTWPDPAAYDAQASLLADLFRKNFQQFDGVTAAIRDSGPIART